MRQENTGVALMLFSVFFAAYVSAAEPAGDIVLPQPQRTGGIPLMQVFNERGSSREFGAKKLPVQLLSSLLWAGFGINRPDSSKRTAPSAMNLQEIDIYVAVADGLYLYDAKNNKLELTVAGDIRGETGKQDFVKSAPVNLVYVADFAKMAKAGQQKDHYAALDTGFIAENVYLFCASEGLSTVVRGLFDQEALAKAMKLRPDQKIILTQTVGYPK